MWNHENLGRHKDRITRTLPAYGSRLFTVDPHGKHLRWSCVEAESAANSFGGNASVADRLDCSDGRKVGNLYAGGKLTFNDIVVHKPGIYQIRVS